MEVGLQRLKHLHGAKDAWRLMVRVRGYGRSEEEARATWGESLKRLSACVNEIDSEQFKSF